MITQLQSLAPPPANAVYAGTASEWTSVESRLGTTLPEDYKQLINLYGAGSFGGYVCPLTPFAPDMGTGSRFSLYRAVTALKIIEPFQQEAPEDFQPFPVYPAVGGLLPWGWECSDAGLQCWRTEGNANSWSNVILDSDWSAEYHEYPVSVTNFLVKWLTGQIVISHYPPFPLPMPLFQPLKLGED